MSVTLPPTPGMTFAERMARALGPLTGPARITSCVTNLLYVAIPAYLDEAARQDGDAVRVGRPGSWSRRGLGDELAEDALPRVYVLPGATVGPPLRSGVGVVDATWELTVGALVSGDDEEDADINGDTYAAAILAILLELGPLAHEQIRSVEWISGNQVPLVGNLEAQRRQLSVVEHLFHVSIEGVVVDTAGLDLDLLPADPTQPPIGGPPLDPGDQPVIHDVSLDLQPRGAGEQIGSS